MAAEAQVYELLAQALVYPDTTFGARIAARVEALPRPVPWAAALADALAGEALDDLQSEHVRLFVNAWGGSPCLPYESVYAEGQLMGAAAHEAGDLYAQWGVEETNEMPDHAAVELAFAAQLARLRLHPGAAEDHELIRQALEAFERDHLRAWLPALGADLRAAAELRFYRAAGNALAAVFGGVEPRDRSGRGQGLPADLFADGEA